MIEQLASVAAVAAAMLKERQQTVAVCDGSTGGLISAGLVAIPGATAFCAGGGVIYSPLGREILLNADPDELKGMRAVTEPYALLQARAIRDRFGADWGVAETGSAGPTHTLKIASGVSCIAVVGPGVALSARIETGSDDRIANMAAFALGALNLLNDALAEAAQSGGR